LETSIDLTLENDSEADASSIEESIKEPTPPAPLPDIQLVLMYIINGRPLEVNKTASIKIEQEYTQFLSEILYLCHRKLPPGKKHYHEGIDIGLQRSWVTGTQRNSKKNLDWSTFDEEADFIALKKDVSNTKNLREMFLMMKALITIDKSLLRSEDEARDKPIETITRIVC
jgi:hypothetical protein